MCSRESAGTLKRIKNDLRSLGNASGSGVVRSMSRIGFFSSSSSSSSFSEAGRICWRGPTDSGFLLGRPLLVALLTETTDKVT